MLLLLIGRDHLDFTKDFDHVLLAILLHHGVVIVDDQWDLLHLVVEHEFEYEFVATELYGSELAIIPLLLSEDALDDAVLGAWASALGLEVLGAVLANEDSQLHDHVR